MIFSKWMCLFAVFALLPVYSLRSFAVEENTIVSVNRIRIDIHGSASEIWPYLMDFRKWSDVDVENLNGEGGQVGDKRLMTFFIDGAVSQRRTEEIIHIEPEQRLTLAVKGVPNENNMAVISDMSLVAIDQHTTRFQLDVYISQEVGQTTAWGRSRLLLYKKDYEKKIQVYVRENFMKIKRAVEAEH